MSTPVGAAILDGLDQILRGVSLSGLQDQATRFSRLPEGSVPTPELLAGQGKRRLWWAELQGVREGLSTLSTLDEFRSVWTLTVSYPAGAMSNPLAAQSEIVSDVTRLISALRYQSAGYPYPIQQIEVGEAITASVIGDGDNGVIVARVAQIQLTIWYVQEAT